jgi:hypothetical protein
MSIYVTIKELFYSNGMDMKYLSILIIFLFSFNIYSQTVYQEIQKVIGTDTEAGDALGNSAISGNYAIIGAANEDSFGSNSGAAYFLELINGTWTVTQKVTASDAESEDWFGVSVSISDNYAVIGAHTEDAAGNDAGAIYFFELVNGTWTEIQKVTASDAQADDQFGRVVSISGNNAIACSLFDDDLGSNSGSVYFFQLINGVWTEIDKATASDGQSDDWFGYSASLSGNYALVGAYREDTFGSNSGAAYFFEFENGNWSEMNKVNSSDAQSDDHFGYSVSISGSNALIGAEGEDTGGSNSGAAYFFKLDAGNWTEVNKVMASDPGAGDWFGWSVAIFENVGLIGSRDDDALGLNSGSAYFFEFDGSSWTELNKVTASDGAASDRFGNSVAIFGDYAIVGAPLESDNGLNAGAAYIFYESTPSISSFSLLNKSNSSVTITASISIKNDPTNITIEYGTTSGIYSSTTTAEILSSDGIINKIINNLSLTTYYSRLRAENSAGVNYSDEISFDIRNFEIPVDGNQDGILDSLQDNVVTILDGNGLTYITIVSTVGTKINSVRTDLSDDNQFHYPFGQLEFNINTSQSQVRVIFHGSSDLSNYSYRKKFPDNTYKQFENAIFSTETIGGNQVAVVTLSLTDGGPGDYDGIVNGVIYDPGGPALPITANIPVWDWWWVIVLFSCVLIIYKRTT